MDGLVIFIHGYGYICKDVGSVSWGDKIGINIFVMKGSAPKQIGSSPMYMEKPPTLDPTGGKFTRRRQERYYGVHSLAK